MIGSFICEFSGGEGGGGGGGGAYYVSAAVRQKFKELITYSEETIEIEITETKKKLSSRTDSAVVES